MCGIARNKGPYPPYPESSLSTRRNSLDGQRTPDRYRRLEGIDCVIGDLLRLLPACQRTESIVYDHEIGSASPTLIPLVAACIPRSRRSGRPLQVFRQPSEGAVYLLTRRVRREGSARSCRTEKPADGPNILSADLRLLEM